MSSSSFRPTFAPGGWRQREAQREAARKEAERKAVEEAERKKYENTEANFPQLSTAHRMPVTAPSVGSNSFSTLAEKWAREQELHMKVEEMRRARNEPHAPLERFVVGSIYRRQREAEEEYPPEPEVLVPPPVRGEPDADGWTEVVSKKNPRKPKRELTIEEMEARDRRQDLENEAVDGEFNGELFESKRHDHDRV